jgi:hypothetical protein
MSIRSVTLSWVLWNNFGESSATCAFLLMPTNFSNADLHLI